MTSKKFCPECQELGKRSFVYIGMSTRTLLSWQSYYDTDGILHDDDPNKISTHYSCSEGHRWTEVT